MSKYYNLDMIKVYKYLKIFILILIKFLIFLTIY